MRIISVVFWIFWGSSFASSYLCLWAQSVEETLSCYGLRYEDELPSDVFMARSACVLRVEPEDLPQWSRRAAEAQTYFAKVGLDVILYVSADELFMGEEIMALYIERLRSRAVEYLVFLDFLPKDKLYAAIVPYVQQGGLLSTGAKAWQKSTEGLKQLYEQLEQTKVSQGLRHSNWIVNEIPELVPTVSFSGKKYLNELPRQLPRLRLAVAARCLPCSEGSSPCDALLQANEQLQQWFTQHYNLDYKFIPRGEAVALGYEYVLYLIRGPVAAVNAVFGKKTQKHRSTAPTQTIVYTFYIKHLLTNARYSLSTRGSTIAEALSPLQYVKE